MTDVALRLQTAPRCLLVLLTFVMGCALASAALAQDALPVSRTNRSILQARDEAAVEPGGFNKADHMTGDWGGLRDQWFDSGRGGVQFL